MADERRSRCDNCRTLFPDTELVAISNPEERLGIGEADPGETIVVPSGECPDCGALCYPAETQEYEVECVNHVEATSHSQAILQVAGNLDDGGAYRMGFRVKNLTTGVEQFIDAEAIQEELDD